MKQLFILAVCLGATVGATVLSTLATVTAYQSSGFAAACFAMLGVQMGLFIVNRLLGGGK